MPDRLAPSASASFGWGERALLSAIRNRVAKTSTDVPLGIGDDCALVRLRTGEQLAVTTDLSIDGRHFRLDWHPAESVGHRALARGLSDLAAMGARPVAAFLSLGLPQKRAGRWLGRFYDGLLALASEHKTLLAGGDLAESPVAVADIVLAGAVPVGKALIRSGARPGDLIYVTGALGGAAAGLARLAEFAASATKAGELKIPKRLVSNMAPHLYPQPRVAQGLWLRRRGLATAAIDISDGLSTDLAHLCEESRTAAEVDAAVLPIHAGASLDQALHGGEDYELLFTARPGVLMPRAIARVPITCIGRMVQRRKGRPQIALVTANGRTPIETRGWEHFSAKRISSRRKPAR